VNLGARQRSSSGLLGRQFLLVFLCDRGIEESEGRDRGVEGTTVALMASAFDGGTEGLDAEGHRRVAV
jgi:hypothetical protein